MDTISALGLGLAARVLVVLVSGHNVRIAGTIVGLLEGFILHSSLRKTRASSESYIAYCVRVLFDFVLTRSFPRLAVVVLWTVLGVLISDAMKGSKRSSSSREHRNRRETRRRRSEPIPSHTPGRTSRGYFVRRDSSIQQTPRIQTNDSTPPSRVSTPSRQLARTPNGSSTPPYPSIPQPQPYSNATTPDEDDIYASGPDHGPSQVSRTIETPTLPVRLARRRSIVEGDKEDEEEDHSVSSGLEGGRVGRFGADGLTSDGGAQTPRSPLSEGGRYDPIGEMPSWNNPPVKSPNDNSTQPKFILPPSSSSSAPLYVPVQRPQKDLSPIPEVNSDIGVGDNSNRMPPLIFESTPAPLATFEDLPSPLPRPLAAPKPPSRKNQTKIPKPKAKSVVSTQKQVSKDMNSALNETLSPPTATLTSPIPDYDRSALLNTANDLRSQAKLSEEKRIQLINERNEAERANKLREAFLLGREVEEMSRETKRFNEKAERRFFLAHNLDPKPTVIDVHGLKAAEAVERTEKALQDLMLSGDPRQTELRVIVGKGNHSVGKVPVLRPAVVKAMQKYKLETTINPSNAGELIITIPPP